MADLTKLTKQLSKIGVVNVIKDDYVFTLYMTKSDRSLETGSTTLPILKWVLGEIKDKQHVEVLRNEADFFLLVMKP